MQYSKDTIRKLFRSKEQCLNYPISSKDISIYNKLSQIIPLGQVVGLYERMNHEPELLKYFLNFYQIMLPVIKDGKIEYKPFSNNIQIVDNVPSYVIVPGVAFSRNKYRVGIGSGYFDKFIASCEGKAKFIGVCYQDHLLKEVPVEAHDKPMDYIVTEEEVIGI